MRTKVLSVFIAIILLLLAVPAISSAQSMELTGGEPAVGRISGRNRYETSVEISKEGWAEGASTLLLARGDNYADALTGVPLAYALDAPILLSHFDRLSDSVWKEIRRLGVTNVIILGGEGVISPVIALALEKMGLSVKRIGGDNRYETARIIAMEMKKLIDYDTAIVACGTEFPDALTAAAHAAQRGYPILLSRQDRLPIASGTALEELSVKDVLIVGGPGAVGERVSEEVEYRIPGSVKRLGGNNRYETATALAEHFGTESNQFYFATGLDFADAVVGAVLVAKNQGSLLLSHSSLPRVSGETLLKYGPERAILFGGTSVISASTQEAIETIVEPTRIYRSSNFQDEYIEISFPSQNAVRVVGATRTSRDRVLLRISDDGDFNYLQSFGIQGDGVFFAQYDLELADGVYKVSIYMFEPGEDTGWGVYWDIPLKVSRGFKSFIKPPVYYDNFCRYEAHAPVKPGHLEINLGDKDLRIVTDLVEDITRGKVGDYEKAQAVAEWVAENIYYDMDAYYGGPLIWDVMGVLNVRRTVCAGYARLTSIMLRAINIPAKVVHGFALGLGTGGVWEKENHDFTNHAWNEVYVDGRWVIVDTTWNSNNEYAEGEYLAREKDYRYFDPLLLAFSYTHKINDNDYVYNRRPRPMFGLEEVGARNRQVTSD